MAYMNQEKKARLAPAMKEVFKKYGVKATISVNNHMTLVATIKSSPIDFIGNFNTVGSKNNYHPLDFRPVVDNIDVNPYWFRDHFDGVARDFLTELYIAMMEGNHDNSDIQSDYFDVGWYIDINIGKWNKPYLVTR